MKEKQTLSYTPLEIEVVEVQIEKGYAATGENEEFTTGNGTWSN